MQGKKLKENCDLIINNVQIILIIIFFNQVINCEILRNSKNSYL